MSKLVYTVEIDYDNHRDVAMRLDRFLAFYDDDLTWRITSKEAGA